MGKNMGSFKRSHTSECMFEHRSSDVWIALRCMDNYSIDLSSILETSLITLMYGWSIHRSSDVWTSLRCMDSSHTLELRYWLNYRWGK